MRERTLNIFYEEVDEDRWFPFDRYPRRVIRRVVRGRPRTGGHARVFLNLRAGLDRIGVRYRINDYRYAKKNPSELVCIIGKSPVVDKIEWKNPILFGPAAYSHPLDDPRLFERRPVKKVLVPGSWMKEMCKPYWHDDVVVWPVGIDTTRWQCSEWGRKSIDVLLYDKVMWNRDHYNEFLIEPIRDFLKKSGHSFREIRYGSYREEDFCVALNECRAMVFLCEHETQGIAYQQALSCGVPIMAWDLGGPWKDPHYFPHRVVFEPVTSVPYWDERCGQRFLDFADLETKWNCFWLDVQHNRFKPREFVLENLTLEKCARNYSEIAKLYT